MKISITTSFISFLIILTSYSCKKISSDLPKSDLPKDITGDWSWIKVISLYPHYISTSENSEYQQLLKFTPDQKWIKLVNSQKVDSGDYSIGHGNYLPYQGADIFIYDSIVFYKESSDQIFWDYYNINDDTLQFSPGYADKPRAYNCFIFPDGFQGTTLWKKQ